MSENDRFKTYHGVVIDRDQLYTKLLDHEKNHLELKKLERLKKRFNWCPKRKTRSGKSRVCRGSNWWYSRCRYRFAGLKTPYATARISYAGSKAGKQAGAGIERIFDIFMRKNSDENLQKRENLLKKQINYLDDE